MDYLGNLRQSIRDVSSRPHLILPLVVQTVIAMLLSMAMLALGIALILPKGAQPSDALLKELFSKPETFAVIGAVFVVAVLIILLISAYFQTGLFGMIRSYLKRGIAGWSEYREGTSHYLPYTGLIIITGLLWLAIAIPLIAGIGAIVGKQLIAGAALLIIGLLVLLVLGLLLTMGLFFAAPIMFFEGTGTIATIKRSFATLRARPITVLATFGLSTAVSLLASLFTWLITLPFNLAATAAPSMITTILFFAIQVVSMGLQLIVALIVLLFLFRNYLSQ